MRKSREETAKSRARILAAAAKRFRERGFNGVSVKDLMAEAGLTHGAFYAHFPSKEALMAAACDPDVWETGNALPEQRDPAGVKAFVARYLSQLHIENPGLGCPLATLASEAPREAPEVQQAFADGIGTLLDRLALTMPRDEAIATLTRLVGSVILARAAGPGDLQAEILAASRKQLGC